MQTDITEEIRGLLEKAEKSLWYEKPKYITQALSLLPKPCSTCRGSGWVDDTVHSVNAGIDIDKPCPECKGLGHIHPKPSENKPFPLAIPCPACQAPAGEIEEFVKTFRRWLKALGTTDITNNQVRVKGYQACTHLTKQAKELKDNMLVYARMRCDIENLQAKVTQFEIRLEESRRLGQRHKRGELANAERCDEYYKQIKELNKCIAQLEAEQKEKEDADKN